MNMKLLVILFLQIIAIETQSQTLPRKSVITYGSIGGTIVDSISNEPIIAANCLLDSTSFGAITDKNGKYLINKVPTGFYRLRFSIVGYEPSTINNIEVTPNQFTEIDVRIVDCGTSWAKEDINAGHIRMCYGYYCDYPDSSLTDKYGFRYYCSCSYSDLEERYNKVAEHYLDVRNGKGWESELEAAWRLIKADREIKTFLQRLREIK
jgi:hypothetical protein